MKTHIGQPLTNSTLKATGVHFALPLEESITTRPERYEERKENFL